MATYILAAGGGQYFPVHDGTIYVPNDAGQITTENAAHAEQLRVLGCTPIQTVDTPPAGQVATPTLPVPGAAHSDDAPTDEQAAPAAVPTAEPAKEEAAPKRTRRAPHEADEDDGS
jgi:hypothetical protein